MILMNLREGWIKSYPFNLSTGIGTEIIGRYICNIYMPRSTYILNTELNSSGSNPFADESGQPREGYRLEFYHFEMKRRKQYLNTLPKTERDKIEAQRQAFFERMQA
jgi:hypothetical protein